MAVRGGLTRFARRYSAHPWASPLRGQRRRCSKTLPAFLSGQPAYCVRGLSNWLRQLSNPGRGFSSPPVENIKEKSPYLRTGSHLEYGGEGGIDSLRSPLRGSPLAGSRSVQLAAPVVEPPIRCRIHTFQACSFSHSDTSPYCLSRCCRERALM